MWNFLKEPMQMYKIYTRFSESEEWVPRMGSISEEYLKTRGHEWKRLGFCNEFKVEKNSS